MTTDTLWTQHFPLFLVLQLYLLHHWDVYCALFIHPGEWMFYILPSAASFAIRNDTLSLIVVVQRRSSSFQYLVRTHFSLWPPVATSSTLVKGFVLLEYNIHQLRNSTTPYVCS